MTIINRSKIIKMADDSQCSEMDILRQLKLGKSELVISIIEDTNKPRYSLQCRQVIFEELGFKYIVPIVAK